MNTPSVVAYEPVKLQQGEEPKPRRPSFLVTLLILLPRLLG